MLFGLIGFISYFEIKEFHAKKVFYLTEIKCKIIKIENNISGGRSYDYITENGVIITLMNSDTLFIGDSIIKEKNNWIFKLYRKKTSENYKFIKSYNYEKWTAVLTFKSNYEKGTFTFKYRLGSHKTRKHINITEVFVFRLESVVWQATEKKLNESIYS